MKRRSNRRNLIAARVFLVLVALGGIALRVTGNFENPFAALTTETRDGGGEGFTPPEQNTSTGSTTTTMTQPAAGQARGDESASLNWSQVGHVLYNAWFLFAAAAFMMLIALPLNAITRRLRPGIAGHNARKPQPA